MRPIWRILRYLRFFPLEISLNVLFNLLHVLFNLGSYVFIIPFVELLFGLGDIPASEPAFALNQHQLADWAFWHLNHYKAVYGLSTCLLAVAACYLACSLLSNLFRYLAMVYVSNIRTRLIERLRNDIYHKVTILPVSYFNHQRRGDLISRMANDIADIDWSIVCTLQSIVKDPINILFFSATLLFVSWRLFLLFLVVLPVGVWLIARIGQSLKRNSQKGQTSLGHLFAMLDESIGSLRVVKAFGRENDRAQHFAQANSRYATTMLKVARRKELSSPLSEILGTLALVVILIIGGWQVIDGSIQPSIFIFFVIVFARLIPPIQSIVRSYNSLQKGSASATRFLEVLDADEVILQKPDAILLPPFHSHISFHNVGFAYNAGQPVLSDINLTLRRGQTLAIVGPSGAGKSTLVDLLPRFYDCTSGHISIDDIPLCDLNIDSLRQQFGIVTQNCILFNDTVANNIAFGSQQYTLEQIQRAAHAAHADSFIDQLPQGYNTPIGDRGLNLSGGQRQRISIARALLRNSPILILDEATSALDSESEHAVQQALAVLMQGRTSIVIAHRLSTIRHADTIVVLNYGHIEEQGTHEQLMARNGLYRKLVDMQAFA